MPDTPETSLSAMDRALSMDLVRVTEATALAASRMMGLGDERTADTAANQAMRQALSRVPFKGDVVIGEHDYGDKVLLCAGTQVGIGQGKAADVALDPLEGATIVAKGADNALSLLAISDPGGFLHAPDLYMEKIAISSDLPADLVDLDQSPADNVAALAKAKGMAVNDMVVCVLDRPRHHQLIGEIRKAGARIRLIDDGDVSAVIAATRGDSGVDAYMGVGGAQQGVMAAAALRCLGGRFQARLVLRNADDRKRALAAGITNPNHKYGVAEMAAGDVLFAATGVTPGALLGGVRRIAKGAITHSVVMNARTGSQRFIETRHVFDDDARP